MDERLTFVIAQLNKRNCNLQIVADMTSLSRRTLYRIAQKSNVPTIDTLDRLYKYFNKGK